MERQVITHANGDLELIEDERRLLLEAPFTAEVRDTAIAGFFTPDAPELPELVPMYKVRKYLVLQQLLASVEAALDALPEPNRSLALVDWEYAPNLVVQSPLALGVKAALGLSDEQYAAMVLAAAAMA